MKLNIADRIQTRLQFLNKSGVFFGNMLKILCNFVMVILCFIIISAIGTNLPTNADFQSLVVDIANRTGSR